MEDDAYMREKEEAFLFSLQSRPKGKLLSNLPSQKEQKELKIFKPNDENDEDSDDITNDFTDRIMKFNKKFIHNKVEIASSSKQNQKFIQQYKNFKKTSDKKLTSTSSSLPSVKFSHLIQGYKQRGIDIPKDFFDGNLFKGSPLLAENKREIDYFLSVERSNIKGKFNKNNVPSIRYLEKVSDESYKLKHYRVENFNAYNTNVVNKNLLLEKEKEEQKAKQFLFKRLEKENKEYIKSIEEISKTLEDEKLRYIEERKRKNLPASMFSHSLDNSMEKNKKRERNKKNLYQLPAIGSSYSTTGTLTKRLDLNENKKINVNVQNKVVGNQESRESSASTKLSKINEFNPNIPPSKQKVIKVSRSVSRSKFPIKITEEIQENEEDNNDTQKVETHRPPQKSKETEEEIKEEIYEINYDASSNSSLNDNGKEKNVEKAMKIANQFKQKKQKSEMVKVNQTFENDNNNIEQSGTLFLKEMGKKKIEASTTSNRSRNTMMHKDNNNTMIQSRRNTKEQDKMVKLEKMYNSLVNGNMTQNAKKLQKIYKNYDIHGHESIQKEKNKFFYSLSQINEKVHSINIGKNMSKLYISVPDNTAKQIRISDELDHRIEGLHKNFIKGLLNSEMSSTTNQQS